MSATSKRALRVVVLLSGRGTNFIAIADAAAAGQINVDVVAAISDRPDASGLEHARSRGIAAECITGNDRNTMAASITELLERFAPDLVVLAGYMRILDDDIVRRYAGRMLNIHPSLLPKYRGLQTYTRALATGESVTGTSVHFVTPELDAGPVVLQASTRIEPSDGVASLKARVQRLEHIYYPRVIGWIADGRLRLDGETVRLDGRPLNEPLVIDGDKQCPEPETLALR